MGFEKIYKQDIAMNTIINGLRNNTLSQSLLFHGKPFSGKLTTALSIAKAMNCINTKNDDYCDNCKICRKIDRFSYPDVFVIDSDSYYPKFKQLVNIVGEVDFELIKEKIIIYLHRFISRLVADFFNIKGSVQGKRLSKNSMIEILDNYQQLINSSKNEKELLKSIDKKVKSKTFLENISLIENFHNLNNIPLQTIKMLMEKMNLTLSEGKKKVFIFNGIELMKKEGSNAFLKSIEEPPKNTQIILITTNLNNILQTIKSRCYLIPFMNRNIDDIKKVFGIVYNKNFEKIDNNKLNDIYSDYPQLIYKKYFISTINMLSKCVANIEKKYKALNTIMEYSSIINKTIKSSSKQDIFIIKQIFLDIINIIKMSKNGYDFKNYIDNYLLFMTKFEEEKLYSSLSNITKYFIRYDFYTLSLLTKRVNDNFNYVFYNNVEIDMTLTNYLIRFIEKG